MRGELIIPPPSAPDVAEAAARHDAPAHGTFGRHARFGAIAFQFFLIVLLTYAFHLESMTFGRVMACAFGGFVIHHYLPRRWRLPFFALLSVGGTILGLAPEQSLFGLLPGSVLVAIGMIVIGACHLPLTHSTRIAVICVLVAALVFLRARWDWFPMLSGVWPVLGSMFVFRIMIYLYDLKHRAAEMSLSRAIAYFFMLPNVCFPLFPVVDYKTFVRTYYNDDPERIYQSGIVWMMRGIVQLLLYRLVYHFAPLSIAGVQDAGDAVGFMVATYLLYLQVSGRFHLIVGLLLMFGFNLPETHHRYLLASSFTDFWRRINIYWKDFIMKLFFYPAFFALRRIGTVRAIALGTLIAFFATWALHVWQWFWLLGVVDFKWQDISFWTILALLVMVNAIREAVAGRRRTLTKRRVDLTTHALTALKTIGTFVTICALWTLWYCGSADELRILAESLVRINGAHVAAIAGGLALIGIAGVLFGGSTRESSEGVAAVHAAPFRFWRTGGLMTANGALLLAILGANRVEDPTAQRVVKALREDQLNARDVDWQRRGYYEELDVVRANQRVWQTRRSEPDGWISPRLFVDREGFLRRSIAPSVSEMLCGTVATTNRWGMRDRDYEKQKPPATYRIVLLGSSHEVGSGVRDRETFENLVEDRLNRENPGMAARYEILNMGVGGYGALRKLYKLIYDGFEFSPDAVLFFICGQDREFDLEDLAMSSWRDQIPEGFLQDVCRRAGVGRGMSQLMIRHRLQAHVDEIYEWMFKQLAAECANRGIRVFAVWRPATVDPGFQEPTRRAELVRGVEKAGLDFIDLDAAFNSVADRDTIVLAPWDDHANATGHRLLADELFARLVPYLRKSAPRADPARPASDPPSSARRHD